MFAYIGVGHLIHKGFGNLNVITEDLIIADLQRFDACPFLLDLGNLVDPTASVGHNRAKTVDLLIIPLGDHSAVTNRKRRVFGNCRIDLSVNILQRFELRGELCELVRMALGNHGFQFWQDRNGGTHGAKILRVCCTVNDFCNKSFEVEHSVKQCADLLSENEVSIQLFDGILSTRNLTDVKQRMLDPAAKQARACRRMRLVKHPQKRATLFLGSHRFGELKISARVDVKLHKLSVGINIQIIEIRDISLLRFLDVGKKSSDRANERTVFFDTISKRFRKL